MVAIEPDHWMGRLVSFGIRSKILAWLNMDRLRFFSSVRVGLEAANLYASSGFNHFVMLDCSRLDQFGLGRIDVWALIVVANKRLQRI